MAVRWHEHYGDTVAFCSGEVVEVQWSLAQAMATPRDYEMRERKSRATVSWPGHDGLELGGAPVMSMV
jgi:hypothetical protein